MKKFLKVLRILITLYAIYLLIVAIKSFFPFFEIANAFKNSCLSHEELKPYAESYKFVTRPPLKYGYVDKTGKVVIKPQFDKAGDFKESFAPACINKKCGYIDKTGKFVIKPMFDDAGNFSEGLAAIEINEKYGYIDKTGKFVIKPVFNYGYEFSEGLAYVNSLEGSTISDEYINKAGKIVIKSPQFKLGQEYKIVSSIFIDGISLIEVNNKYGFINKTGKVVIPVIFDSTKFFNEGLAPVKQDTKYGNTLNLKYKSPNDKTILLKNPNGKWESIDKTVLLRQNGKWGFIDKTGNYVIEPRFDAIDNFSEGLAPVKINDEYGIDKWGFIDKNGYPIIDPKFEDAGKFQDGLAPIMLDNKVGYINKKGEIVIKPQFGERRFPNDGVFCEGMARVNINDKIGFINKQGKLVVKPVYIDVENFSEGFAKVGVK
jgi:hypothetical protein